MPTLSLNPQFCNREIEEKGSVSDPVYLFLIYWANIALPPYIFCTTLLFLHTKVKPAF